MLKLLNVNTDLTIQEKYLLERFSTNDTHLPKGVEKDFFDCAISNHTYFSKRILRLILQDILNLLQLKSFSEDALKRIAFLSESYCETDGFYTAGRSKEDFGGSLLSIWINNYFHYKNYGYVHKLPSSTRGLLMNENTIQWAITGECFNWFGGYPIKKGREIENFYEQQYKQYFRTFLDDSLGELELIVLLSVLHYCGFYYQGKSPDFDLHFK